MAATRIVEVKNLTKIFTRKSTAFSFLHKKRFTTAVNNISFEIKKGEIVGLLGPNGAGKTTTIQMLMGLITPSTGIIKIFGKNFSENRKEILKKMNFSSSYTHLPWRLTVWENLNVVARLYGIPDPSGKIQQIMKSLNLESKKNDEVAELSSGWTTRLNLARTFINDPEFILLDEPTASLDPEGADEIRKRILRLRHEFKTTVLWTSHNMAEVEEVCDRVIFLTRGRIIAEDTPQGLAKRIRNVRIYLMLQEGRNKLAEIAAPYDGIVGYSGRFVTIEISETKIPQLLNSFSRSKIKYSEISIDKPTLEDYFLSVAKEKQT